MIKCLLQGDYVFIKIQDGTKMYFTMLKAAENYFSLVTQLPLKPQG